MEDAQKTIRSLLASATPSAGTAKPAAGGKGAAFFAVYDGHGGPGTAQYCGVRLHEKLAGLPAYASGEYEAALKTAFLGIDVELLTGGLSCLLPSVLMRLLITRPTMRLE